MKKFIFQEKAIESLLKYTINNIEEEHIDITFSSPVGSGKTIMLGQYMNQLPIKLKSLGIEEPISFFWISPGKGKLDEQSKNKINKLSSNINCMLLKDLLVNQEIKQNDAIFTDWQKLNSDNNIAWRNGDFNGLDFILNNRNTKIILIIDEAHDTSSTEISQNIIDKINPFLTVYVTATPKNIVGKNINVEIDDVISEGLIKSSVEINENIKFQKDSSFVDILISKAIDKRNELEKLYRKNDRDIIPLCLIQIENDSSYDRDNSSSITNCQRLKQKLIDFGIDEEKIAIWLATEKSENLNDIVNNDVQFLIFKQAVATGWDCPRSQILVRLRETSSIIFDIQTIGRIMRMPELYHYAIKELNKAYIYTDDDNFEYNATIDEKMKSKIRSELNVSYIKEKFISEKMEMSITSEKMSIQYSGLIDGETLYDLLFKILTPEIKKLNKDITITRKFLYGDIETNKFYDNKFEMSSNKTIDLSDKDISDRFYYYVKKIYTKFNISNYLYSIAERSNINRKDFRKIFLANREQLTLIIKNAIDKYENTNLKFRTKRIYTIPEQAYFNKYIETNIDNNYIYNKLPDFKFLFENKLIKEPEYKFSKYLLENNKIKCWWKNGDMGEDYFSILYKIKTPQTKITETIPFYPDYLMITKKNELFIIETKGLNDIDSHTEFKYNAIAGYLKKNKNCFDNYTKVFFSIVRFIDDTPYVLVNTDKYISSLSDSKHWIKFDNLFKEN